LGNSEWHPFIRLSMEIEMNLFSLRSSKKKKIPSITEVIRPSLICFIFVLQFPYLPLPDAAENQPNVSSVQSDDGLADIVNPFKSTCYDWSGTIVPCNFKRPYAELLSDKPIPNPRFVDNQDGTVTDNLTELIWLKNTNCFGMTDWISANQRVKRLKDGDCGPDPTLMLSDGSSPGDWRLPTMSELCTLIDFSKRDPALPTGHMFAAVPSGYHWSATTLEHYSGVAWIVYFESGTTCYENVKNQAGHILPVRKPLE